VIECQLFPQLIDVMVGTADYKTRKEAAWAVLNATAGGTDEQIRSEKRPPSPLGRVPIIRYGQHSGTRE